MPASRPWRSPHERSRLQGAEKGRDDAPGGGRALLGPPPRGRRTTRHAAAPGDPGGGGPVRAGGDPPDQPPGSGDPERPAGRPRGAEGVPRALRRRRGGLRPHGPHRDGVPGVPRLPERGDRFPGAGRGGRPGALRQAGAAQVQGRHLGVRQQLHEGRGERRRDQGVDRAALGRRRPAPSAGSARPSARRRRSRRRGTARR